LVKCTVKIRSILPAGKYLLSHSPRADWFRTDGIYRLVHNSVGTMIDWYNIEYYNLGTAFPLEDKASIFDSFGGGAIKELLTMHVGSLDNK
jgi:hypothetical protein